MAAASRNAKGSGILNEGIASAGVCRCGCITLTLGLGVKGLAFDLAELFNNADECDRKRVGKTETDGDGGRFDGSGRLCNPA
jgi:hypothetical protein